jgi:hypothetical protein
MRSRSILACFVALAFGVFAAPAAAEPGAYRVLMTEAHPEGPHELAAQIATFPGFASFDFRNTELETPSAAELAPYDAVVSVGDNSYLDAEAWGNSLATYLESGQGVVVQFAYDNWDSDPVSGRWLSAGFAPFIPGPNENNATSLGAFDPADPLMQGVTTLNTLDNTTPTLAPGARLVATWANGDPAIAAKGRAVSVSAFVGDNYGPGVWSGEFGRLVVNAVRTLGAQKLTVVKKGSGTVKSSVGGISCGATCSAILPAQTQVTLSAKPKKGSAFAGFSGACTGKSCKVTPAGGVAAVTASFVSFGGKSVRLDKGKGTAKLKVRVGAAGKVMVSGGGIKKALASAKAARTLTLPIVAKGAAAKTLAATGKAKVKVAIAFTPKGGATAKQSRSIVLVLG